MGPYLLRSEYLFTADRLAGDVPMGRFIQPCNKQHVTAFAFTGGYWSWKDPQKRKPEQINPAEDPGIFRLFGFEVVTDAEDWECKVCSREEANDALCGRAVARTVLLSKCGHPKVSDFKGPHHRRGAIINAKLKDFGSQDTDGPYAKGFRP